MFSKDVDLVNRIKDEGFISMTILGTEGEADWQDGRKPGGVVNSSVDKKVTETLLLYDEPYPSDDEPYPTYDEPYPSYDGPQTVPNQKVMNNSAIQ